MLPTSETITDLLCINDDDYGDWIRAYNNSPVDIELRDFHYTDFGKEYQYFRAFLRSNVGPSIPGFRYLLDRYFEISAAPDACAARLSLRKLADISERPA